MLTETFTHVEDGIEAVVTIADAPEFGSKKQFQAKVIFRDIDANENISVKFGSPELCIAAAKKFVGIS